MLQYTHDNHHTHEQEYDVHINGLDGGLIRHDVVLGIEGPEGITDDQHGGGTEHGSQGTVQELKGYKHIRQHKYHCGNPEGRACGTLYLEISVDHHSSLAGGYVISLHYEGGPGVTWLERGNFYLGAMKFLCRHMEHGLK